jgi:hypothetical protein
MRVPPLVYAVRKYLRVGIVGRTACALTVGRRSTGSHQRSHTCPFAHPRDGAETAMRGEDGGYTPPVSGQVTIRPMSAHPSLAPCLRLRPRPVHRDEKTSNVRCRELTMAKDQLAEIQRELNEIHARMAHKSATDPLHMLTLTIQFFLLLHEEGEIRHRELVLRLTVLEHAMQELAQRMAADPGPSHEPGAGSRRVGSVSSFPV